MRRGSYRVIEYGGKYSGCASYRHTSDELVLGREDIAYVMKALHRGNADDKAFAKKMFNTLCPHLHCDCCGHWISTASSDDEPVHHTMYGKVLCYKCWFIMSDIDYCLNPIMEMKTRELQLRQLASVQKGREDWCPRKINYLVNERTYDKCVKKYKELFGEQFKEDIL